MAAIDLDTWTITVKTGSERFNTTHTITHVQSWKVKKNTITIETWVGEIVFFTQVMSFKAKKV